MKILFLLARRNLFRHRWRTLATALGVALGIAAVLATLSVGDNVRANVMSTLEAATGRADLLVTPGAQGRAVFSIDEIREKVETTPGVERVRAVLNHRAEPIREIQALQDSVLPGIDTGFQLSGLETEHPEDLPAYLSAGTLPEAGSEGIAIAEGFARSRGMNIGDTVQFATQYGAVPFTVTGLLDDSLGLASTNGGRIAVLHISDLQNAIRLAGRATHFEVMVSRQASVQEVQARLQARLGEAYTATLPASSGDLAAGVIGTLQAGLQILAATLIALAGFMAYNTFGAAVAERTREYALLRTISLTRRQVQRLALLEALLVSAIGVVLGLIFGLGLSYVITLFNAYSLGFEFRTLVIPLPSILFAVIVGVLVSLIAGFLPARSASRTPPVVAFRTSEARQHPRLPRFGWLLLVLGVLAALVPWQGHWALLGAALAMAMLFTSIIFLAPVILQPAIALLAPLLGRAYGVAGRLGSSFTLRNAQRNGVAIGAVIVGMGLTIGVGSMVAGINQEIRDWVDTTIVGDMFVTSPVNFPETFEQDVAERVPAIDWVSGLALTIVRFEAEGLERGRSVVLILVDPERFHPLHGFGRFKYIPGQGDNQTGYETLQAGGRVLAANTILDRFGIGRGDTARLRTMEGFRDFPVGGVVVDFTGGGEAFVGSIRDKDLFGLGTPDLYVMTVHEGQDPAQVREALLAAFPELYLDVTLNHTYRERILSLTQQTFTTTNGLLFLALLIAALGVANTLGMNLSSRQHEIGMLRALGLTRRGVGHLINAEGIVIMVVGTILGILCGLLLSHVITAGASALTGYRINPAYPWRLILLSILCSPVVGLLASYGPARRVARLSPVQALGGTN
jgi:putative ABC transport system permease protein